LPPVPVAATTPPTATTPANKGPVHKASKGKKGSHKTRPH
jgi:hypothetical protein